MTFSGLGTKSPHVELAIPTQNSQRDIFNGTCSLIKGLESTELNCAVSTFNGNYQVHLGGYGSSRPTATVEKKDSNRESILLSCENES
ncbi:MAG: hypothetical protein ACAH59_04185 [Pseudobdellovibrionaceae bacterium]